jgi:hypothetical protein
VLENEVIKIQETMKEEEQEFSIENLNKLWIFTKIMTLSNKKATFSYLTSKIDEFLINDSSKRYLAVHSLTSSSQKPNIFFLPSSKGLITHLLCIKSNLLLLCPSPCTLLFPSPAFLSALPSPLPSELLPQVIDYILSPSFRVRREVFKILHGSMAEKKDVGILELMKEVAMAPPGLDAERVYANSLQKLMNIFRAGDSDVQMQKIYLYFLFSLFFLKFTPVYKHAQKAIGELIEIYHDTIIEYFEEVLDFIEEYIKTPPNHEARREYVPNHLKLFVYKKYETDDNPQKLENRHSTTIKVFECILKGYGYAIEKVSEESKRRLTKRFKRFFNKEFLKWHPEFAKYLGREVEL